MKKRKKKRKINEKKLIIKFLLCLVYLVIITILFYCSYLLYQEKQNVISWNDVKTNEDYAYINVSKMSEKFAYYEHADKEIHFVIEEEDTGVWHTYLIAIKPKDYKKYKEIIDYTYERNLDKPDPVKVYGYPVIIEEDLKELAIKNIKKFIPKENEISITNENFEKYLTNSYLDTTKPRIDKFNIYIFITFFLMVIMIVLFIYTIFAKETNSLKPYKKAVKEVKKLTNK
ncbi:MAG: hypothetical protein E7160_01640 [Firmicutes bacterium]|nr:hypothetical protein [Bacillota bacterium]